MKKFISAILFAFMTVVVFAQTNPTRMFVRDKAGVLKGFLVERIDSVFFYNEEGIAKVDMTFHEFNNENPKDPVVICSFKRSEDCATFRYMVLPKPKADALTSAVIAAKFLEDSGASIATADFDHGEMNGFSFEFVPGATYAVIVVAYDRFGIAGEMSRTDFTVPAAEIKGKPIVSYNIDNIASDSITLSMAPNKDCSEYYVCLYEEGSFEAQYKQWAPMMGFACYGDMVKAWGVNPKTKLPYYTKETHTWNALSPGVSYDIYIQPCDVNGNYGDLIHIKVTTKAIGGDGVSEISIKIGNFGSEEVDGVTKYWQQVIYTPNNQTNLHRDIIIKKSAIGSADFPNEEAVINYLKTDNPYDPYQNQYGVDDVKWTVDANAEYIAYAIGQNAKGEWGTVAKKEFKTPASVSEKKADAPVVAVRANACPSNCVMLPGGTVINKTLNIR